MNLKFKAPVLVAIAAAGIFASTGYYAYRAQFDYLDEIQAQEMRAVAERVKSGIVAQGRGASSQAEFLANLTSVREALASGDRAALAEQFLPIFKLMKSKYGAEQAVFHSANLKVFLNLANVGKYGEDVSNRETIVRANRYRETQSGVEVGASGINVRAVASIDSGSVHLGSFEWGVGFVRLLSRIKDNTGCDVTILVDDRQIPHEASRGASSEDVREGLRTIAATALVASGSTAATGSDVVTQLLGQDFLEGVQDEIYTDRTLGTVDYGVFAIPFFDFAGRQIGVIAGAKSMAESQQKVRAMRSIFLGATALGTIVLGVVVFIAFRVLLLRPLEALEKDFEVVASGIMDVPATQSRRADEIGAVAKSLDKLREKQLEDARLAEEAKLALRTKSGRYRAFTDEEKKELGA